MLKIHIVQKGDTITKIAKQFQVDVNAIILLNPQIASPDMIMPGMKLKIPSNRKQVRTAKKATIEPFAKTPDFLMKNENEGPEEKRVDEIGNNVQEETPRLPSGRSTYGVEKSVPEFIAEPAERPMEGIESTAPEPIAEPAERPMDDVKLETYQQSARPEQRPFKEMPMDDIKKSRFHLNGNCRPQTQVPEQISAPQGRQKEQRAEMNQYTCCHHCNRPMYIDRPVYYPFPWTQMKPNFYVPPNMPEAHYSKKKKPEQPHPEN
jgi:morphogenetic protein associated with SpoVID